MNTFFVQQAGWIGTPEIVLIVLAIVLLFGGRKIPELMRGIGKGIKEFKEGINDPGNAKENNAGNNNGAEEKK